MLTKMAVESAILGKSPLTNFQKLIHQITFLADFTHFEQPFHYKTEKQPISSH